MLGCSPKAKLECSSLDATSATSDLVRDAIEKATWKLLTMNGQPSQVGHSRVRATIRQLLISIEDIRTAKEDPTSTKRFCTGNLTIRIPADVLADADAARGDANLANVSALADQSDMDREADTFKASFDYDVQPTDNGDKVYAETTILPKFSDFFAQVVASSLLKPVLEQAKVQQQQMVAAQQQQQAAAQNEKRQADLAQARADEELATQSINAVWKNIASDQRTTLLPDQRAWIRRKTADCDVEAAGASTDPIEQQTSRLKCDTRMTQERLQVLRSLAGASPNGAFQ
jgi:uncharacterized protein YecT (DUF1311 family)